MTGAMPLHRPILGRLLFESVDLILALHSMALGLWLLMPWSTFASSITFRMMGTLAPEWVWGGVILAGGLGLFTALLLDNIQWRLRILRGLAFLWLVVAMAMAVANLRSIAAISYIFFGLIYIRAYLRLAALNGR